MKIYQCPDCRSRIFFENMACLACGCQLGYAPGDDVMLPLHIATTGQQWQACGNRNSLACNWLAPVSSAGVTLAITLCDCCSFTRTIPAQDDGFNQQAWRDFEQAKRYLFYSLHALGLPLPDRVQRPETGLVFDLLAQLPEQEQVLTGHDTGVITINVAEADHVQREQRRISMHEPYRTMLGHLRHEIGHFYWDQLLADSPRLEGFRTLFGDERQDYAQALQQHYERTDDGSWQAEHISRYASSHPWEDWAECWAHYLHISDALHTAAAWRVGMVDGDDVISSSAVNKSAPDQDFKEQLIKEWLPLSQYLNAACRSLGESDAYPFVLSSRVIDKLVFVHFVIRNA